MKKILFLLALVIGLSSCGKTEYNKEAVYEFLEGKDVVWWVQTFENNSNLIQTETRMGMVISKRELNSREIRAVKAYLKDEYNAEEVQFQHRPDYY